MATETCTLLQRSGLCAEGQRLWALDADVGYSASTEKQPKGTVAAWIVSSSGNEKFPEESSYCPVVAWAHSLNTSTTRAGLDCKETHWPWHLCKTGQGDQCALTTGSQVEPWRIRPFVVLIRTRIWSVGAYIMWIKSKYYKNKHTLELKITYFGLHVCSELFDRIDDVAFSPCPSQGIWNFL